jgi:hypothetical protein
VYESPVAPSISIAASTALLEAGLRRAVAESGLRLADVNDSAAIRLHAEDVGAAADVPVDIEVSADRVTITVRGALEPGTWTALRAIVGRLVGPA